MASLLPAVLALAAVDAINPTSIAGAIYLAGSGRRARLRAFILGVYCTYLCFGSALVLGPGTALRSALGDTPTMIAPIVEVGIGGLLVAIGIRTWRRRASRAVQASPRAGLHSRSGFALGFLATLADLPTAGPLLVATMLLAAASLTAGTRIAVLGLYDLVYVGPLLAIAVAHGRARRANAFATWRRRRSLNAVPAVTVLCVACGALLGIEGLAALV